MKSLIKHPLFVHIFTLALILICFLCFVLFELKKSHLEVGNDQFIEKLESTNEGRDKNSIVYKDVDYLLSEYRINKNFETAYRVMLITVFLLAFIQVAWTIWQHGNKVKEKGKGVTILTNSHPNQA